MNKYLLRLKCFQQLALISHCSSNFQISIEGVIVLTACDRAKYISPNQYGLTFHKLALISTALLKGFLQGRVDSGIGYYFYFKLYFMRFSTSKQLHINDYLRHFQGTNLAQCLQAQKTQCMAGLEPKMQWLGVQYLNHSAIRRSPNRLLSRLWHLQLVLCKIFSRTLDIVDNQEIHQRKNVRRYQKEAKKIAQTASSMIGKRFHMVTCDWWIGYSSQGDQWAMAVWLPNETLNIFMLGFCEAKYLRKIVQGFASLSHKRLYPHVMIY